MQYLRQSTASQEISLGYFLDSTDGNTEETALTIANTDIKLRKGGATTLANKNSGGATHISNGIYYTTLDATDTDTLGMLEIYVHVTGALAVKNTYIVLPTASYDAIVANGLNNIAATDIVSGGPITTSGGAVSNVTTVATTTTNADMRGTDNALLASSAPTNFGDLSITVSTGQVTVGTNNDKTGYLISGTKTTLDALNDITATDIVSSGPITTLGGAVSNVTTVATTTTNTDMRGTDNALLASNYTAPDNATIADTNTRVTNLNDITAADVWNSATRELTSGNNIVLAKGVGVTGFNDLSFSDVWTGTLTESYATNGGSMTPAQGIHMIWSDLRSPAQVGTTWSDYRLDNTTVAMTFTLDDATTPTSKTRAS